MIPDTANPPQALQLLTLTPQPPCPHPDETLTSRPPSSPHADPHSRAYNPPKAAAPAVTLTPPHLPPEGDSLQYNRHRSEPIAVRLCTTSAQWAGQFPRRVGGAPAPGRVLRARC